MIFVSFPDCGLAFSIAQRVRGRRNACWSNRRSSTGYGEDDGVRLACMPSSPYPHTVWLVTNLEREVKGLRILIKPDRTEHAFRFTNVVHLLCDLLGVDLKGCSIPLKWLTVNHCDLNLIMTRFCEVLEEEGEPIHCL